MPRVVLLVIDDDELLAMSALALQLAGIQALVASSVDQASARAAVVELDAIVVVLGRPTWRDWSRVLTLRTGMAAVPAALVIAIDAGTDVPAAVMTVCAATLMRPLGAEAVVSAVLAVLG